MSDEIQEISYTPLPEEFGAEEMFAQGAAAIDLAAIFALERKDFDGLIRVAREWTRMGATISGVDAPEEGKKVVLKFGFSKEPVEEENDGETDSKSDGKDDIQNKGRLYSYRIRSHRSGS